MAKSIRLINVDEIIDSDGNPWVPDTTNLAITSGGDAYNYTDASNQKWKIHCFKSSDQFFTTSPLTIEIMIMAGGGYSWDTTASSAPSSGGGAGGVVILTNQQITAGTHSITVGGAGGNSTFGVLTTAIAGGRGGYSASSSDSLSGGSGGGGVAGYPGYAGKSGTSGQGNSGESGFYSSDSGNWTIMSSGGGGGKGSAGGNASASIAGAGGDGINNVFTDVTTTTDIFTLCGVGENGWIASGGGGFGFAQNTSTPARPSAKLGGGGGAYNTTDGITYRLNGVQYTGGGASGISQSSTTQILGGSGAIILRFKL